MRATDEHVAAAREAGARYAWSEALEHLTAAEAVAPLEPEDLDLLAECYWWLGRMRDCIAARERAHTAYLARNDSAGAARAALELTWHHGDLLETSVAGAWLQRAAQLLADEPEQATHARLHFMLAGASKAKGMDVVMGHLDDALRIASAHGDRDMMALTLAMQGALQVRVGEVDAGLSLMEEATVAAVGGELGPVATGWIYCMMISTAASIADWQRAGEWTDAAKRWCDRQAINGFPGVCRVHRAEIMRLRGSLADAEEEARAAMLELGEFNLEITGWAFYELGEIRLRIGDLDAAEEAFAQAHQLGKSPQPGLAMVQMRRRKFKAAFSALKRALGEPQPPTERAKLLPVLVEAAIEIGRVEDARAAADELQEIARGYSAPAMQAAAEAAHARVALVDGDLSAAEAAAKRAVRLWKQADLSYEAARVCLVLADVYAAEGDHEGAELELRSAQSTFERLGAMPDCNDAIEQLKALASSATPTGRRVTRTFIFSDIVRSTNLVEAIGDDAWMDLLKWHDETLRRLFAAHGGEVVTHTGDGFFVVFENTDDAMACAVAIQRSLAAHRRAHGFAPQVRMGVHATEAAEVDGNYHGQGIHEAARIAALAGGGEILASSATVGCLSGSIPTSEVRTVQLKGITEQVEIVTVGWREA